jgi:hypothetical protein
MSVVNDIFLAWRKPRQVMQRHLSHGVREDRALAFLMIACFLIFVAQWPSLSRAAYFQPEISLQQRIASTLFAWLFVVPLMAYGLAALSHMIARLFGGQGSWYGARLALFWALLASIPAWVLYGLVTGLIGDGPAERIVGIVLWVAFGVIWWCNLWVAETQNQSDDIL